jgi:hypothetical protein
MSERSRLAVAVGLFVGSLCFVFAWGAHASGSYFGPAPHVADWPIYLGALGIVGGIVFFPGSPLRPL